MHRTSPLLECIPGLQHAFGSASEPVPEPFVASWPEAFPRWKQVHGVRIAEARQAREELGECDGIVCFQSQLPIAVTSADCVPVLMGRTGGRAVAALHAGWRGTLAGAALELVRALVARGEEPARWVAAIGPAIGPCCYEVSEELAREFGSPTRMLDLPALNAAQLRAAGIGEVELLRACTRCSRDERGAPLYASFRRDGRGLQQRSVIAAR